LNTSEKIMRGVAQTFPMPINTSAVYQQPRRLHLLFCGAASKELANESKLVPPDAVSLAPE
jgi:hypothetical protein